MQTTISFRIYETEEKVDYNPEPNQIFQTGDLMYIDEQKYIIEHIKITTVTNHCSIRIYITKY